MSQAILYSFRRCPYAIRARLALYHSGVRCELREVVLKNKPEAMLEASPKGTVPVLVLPERVLDESLDIMRWALSQSTNQGAQAWHADQTSHELVSENDGYFKTWLDRYKYFDRYPEASQSAYFDKARHYLAALEASFVPSKSGGWSLVSDEINALDAAIFPFVRQFAFVDKPRFDELDLPKLLSWLEQWLASTLFSAVMDKASAWVPSQQQALIFGKS